MDTHLLIFTPTRTGMGAGVILPFVLEEIARANRKVNSHEGDSVWGCDGLANPDHSDLPLVLCEFEHLDGTPYQSKNNCKENMPRATVSIDDWKCPWCKEHNRFESVTAGATHEGDLSGFVDTLDCPNCDKQSTVSLSIQFRAEPIPKLLSVKRVLLP